MTITTKQEAFQLAFTTSVRGLASQGWEQCRETKVSLNAHPSVGCRWTVGDRHCPVGWLIEPKAPENTSGGVDESFQRGLLPELMEWVGTKPSDKRTAFRNFMEVLLTAHDYNHSPELMHSVFVGIGKKYKLDWPADVA